MGQFLVNQSDPPTRVWHAVACVVGAVFMAVASACGDNGPTAEEHLSQARQHIVKNDLRAGVIELKNAIQKDPDLADARLALGEAYLRLGAPPAAEKELARARELGTPDGRVLVPLAEAWLGEGRNQDVLNEVIVDDSAPPEGQAVSLVLRGLALLGLGDRDAGERNINDALKRAPNNAMALVALSRLSLMDGDLDAAKVLNEKARSAAPGDPDVLSQAGRLDRMQGHRVQAVADYRALVETTPDNPHYQLLLAEAQIANDEIDPAITTLDALFKRYANQPYGHYLRALAAYQKQDFEGAKKNAQVMLEVSPSHLPTLLVLGGAHFALKEDEQAINYLERFVTMVQGHEPARRMLSAALLRAGDSAKAREILRPLEASATDDAQLLAMIGTAAVRSGDLQAGERYFERLTEVLPDDPAARAQLGTIRVSIGEVEEGALDLERAVEQNPDLRSLTTLAMTYIRARQFDQALTVAERIAKQFPESAIGSTLSGIANMGLNNVVQAQAAFEEALSVSPGAVDASMNLATLKANQGDVSGARTILQDALDRNPKNAALLTRVADVDARLGRFGDAEERLRTLTGLNPDDVGPKVMLARLYLTTQKPQEALDIAAGQVAMHPDNAALLEVVGQAYRVIGQAEQSLRVFQRLVAASPDNAGARLQLALAYEQTGQRDKAKAALDEAIALQPDFGLAKIGMARIALSEGNVDRAADLVEEIDASPQDSVDDPRFLEIKADVALAKNDPATAASLYRAAFHGAPNTQRVLKLTQARQRSGDAAYRVALDDWITKNPGDTVARLYAANDDVATKRYEPARRHYEVIVARAPDNVLALNNLAWLLLENGQADTALTHAERALELAPNSAAIKDTAGLVHLELGNISRAATLLGDAAKALPDNADVQLHYAKVLNAQGDTAHAREVLQRALSSNANFSDRADAVALLKQLGG